MERETELESSVNPQTGKSALLAGVLVAVKGAFAVNVIGSGIGERFFHAFELGGIYTEFGGIALKFLT